MGGLVNGDIDVSKRMFRLYVPCLSNQRASPCIAILGECTIQVRLVPNESLLPVLEGMVFPEQSAHSLLSF